jgi:RNA polymerase sigma factor (sigma-70 family)
VAEDAFQAAFLVLALHPERVRKVDSLAAWLHGVAVRVARKARRTMHRGSTLQPKDNHALAVDPLAEMTGRELVSVIDEELARLPDTYKAVVLLCCLEGLSQDEAAKRLGWTAGSVKGRLERGRDRLRKRLSRRGVTLATGLAVLVIEPAASGLSPGLLNRTAGFVDFGTVSPAVRQLAAAVVPWAKVLTTAFAATLLVAGGISVTGAGDQTPVRQPPIPANPTDPPTLSPNRVDRYGDPLPDGAIARLGSTRFRHANLSSFVVMPDGRTVATAGGSSIRTWDMSNGLQVRSVRLSGEDPTGKVKLSSDGSLAVAPSSKGMTVWDAVTGDAKASFRSPESDVHSHFFSPDGGSIAVLSWKASLTLHNWRTGDEKKFSTPIRRIGKDSTFHGHFSPDGRKLVVGGGFGEPLTVLNTSSGEVMDRFFCSATSSIITPDSRTLVVSCSQGQTGDIRLFDLSSGRETARFEVDAYFYHLAVSPDGTTLACQAMDRSRLIDLRTGNTLVKLGAQPWEFGFTPDGKTLVASSTGQQLHFYRTADGLKQTTQPGNLGPNLVMTSSVDGRYLATAAWMDTGVTVWDLADGRLVQSVPLVAGDRRYVNDLALSRGGRALTTSQEHRYVSRWDSIGGGQPPIARPVPRGLRPYYLRLSADGRYTAALEPLQNRPRAARVTVWDTAKGEILGRRTVSGTPVRLAWATDASWLAIPTGTDLVVVDGKDPSKTWFTIPDVGQKVFPFVTTPDGRLIAARADRTPKTTNGEIVVAEVASGKVVATLSIGSADHFALHPMGRFLVTAGDGLLKAFDLVTGRETGRLTMPEAVTGLLLPEPGRVVTSLADGTGIVWDFDRLSGPTARPQSDSSSNELETAWEALATGEARRTFSVGWTLCDRPVQAVEKLRTYLRPMLNAEESTVRDFVGQLDAPLFADREKAEKALMDLGETATAHLRTAMATGLSAEQRARLKRLLAAFTEPVLQPGDRLRQVRAVAVLERIGSADAKKLLTELANGTPEARLTREAKASLDRLRP